MAAPLSRRTGSDLRTIRYEVAVSTDPELVLRAEKVSLRTRQPPAADPILPFPLGSGVRQVLHDAAAVVRMTAGSRSVDLVVITSPAENARRTSIIAPTERPTRAARRA